MESTTLDAHVGAHLITIHGLVSQHVTDLLLGIDWLEENEATWRFAPHEVVLAGKPIHLHARKEKCKWCRRVMIASDNVIPARSQQDLTANVQMKDARHMEGTLAWATEPRQLRRGVLVARTLHPDKVGELPVRVINMTNKPVKLAKDSVLSTPEPVSPLKAQQQPQPSNQNHVKDAIEGMISNVDKSFGDDVKDKLRQVLLKHSAVFSKDEWDLGWTDLVTHEIDTADAKPIRQPLRRYPPSHQEAIDQQVWDMLRQKVIQPASSPWASNVVLAKKKDGTLRCFMDYRQLNDVRRKNAYTLPRTYACLVAMAGYGIFSTFDLRSGFHQVAMEQRDADKTAFRTRRDIFRFRTMIFGLCNATASFQRLMDLVLTGLNFEICLAYLDDVILCSRTPEEHLGRLDYVLQRLEDASLKIKPSKCCLMQTKVTFLGHIVGGEGLASDPEKVQLVDD